MTAERVFLMIIKQLSIFVENKRGRLAEITGLLHEAQIDIRALCIADTKNFGILRLIVDDPDKAEQVLKENDCTVSLTNVLTIRIDDQPGGLATPMKILSDYDISVEYMYAFISKDVNSAYVILRVDDNDKAIEVFQKNDVTMVSAEEIYNM